MWFMISIVYNPVYSYRGKKLQFMIDVIGLELHGWLNQTQMGISFEISF